MNTENKEAKRKSGRIWGWIITIIGGLYFGWMLYAFGSTDYKSNPPDFEELGYLLVLLIPLVCAGLPILAIGLWRLFLSMEGKSRRIWGWASTFFGSLYLLIGALVVVDRLSSSYRWAPVQNQANLLSILAPILGFELYILTIGVLLLVLGIREIIRKGKTPNVDVSGMVNMPEKVEK
jgi:hypothetical protein